MSGLRADWPGRSLGGWLAGQAISLDGRRACR
jgi:hypothetical protein